MTSWRRRWGVMLVAWTAAMWAMTTARAQERVLDDFDDLAAWSVSATDDVHAALRSVEGSSGKALCIDFDFGKVTGYVSARRRLPLDFPARYRSEEHTSELQSP